ncbi:methyltransferase domain-containing protein [Chamaesiphon polymorphus]|uniref:Methyltransferase type 11 n=1 Tax=Chamaesiphon polymorphus CCALA 037 TaxID=2107692 RepID=A0A2T1GET2_9CYAN|nr:methyltransferase domain-containing protein [Chamaesiphon polymorphus]PSB56083.1 methyltransferase type 11 [Chamaesiphon polymorphus CCALA 037]
MSPIKLSESSQKLLHCPVCHAELNQTERELECLNSECTTSFPIVDGIPVLINERASVFAIDDFRARRQTFFKSESKNQLVNILKSLIPDISRNIKGAANYRHLSQILLECSPHPRVLVIGGSILGDGMEYLVENTAIELVESDVAFGERTMLISDAHDLPFQDGAFDGVIAQAVLEHVLDPHRCCAEIYRVLNDRGVVYAETPFMQQVHNSPYDFTRFTHFGHRRLFRHFEEIDSGAVCGPGMALASAYMSFLVSFTTSKVFTRLLIAFARLTSFYLKYFDYLTIDKPGARDAASGYYFIGRKSDLVLSDRDLIKLYQATESPRP